MYVGTLFGYVLVYVRSKLGQTLYIISISKFVRSCYLILKVLLKFQNYIICDFSLNAIYFCDHSTLLKDYCMYDAEFPIKISHISHKKTKYDNHTVVTGEESYYHSRSYDFFCRNDFV